MFPALPADLMQKPQLLAPRHSDGRDASAFRTLFAALAREGRDVSGDPLAKDDLSDQLAAEGGEMAEDAPVAAVAVAAEPVAEPGEVRITGLETRSEPEAESAPQTEDSPDFVALTADVTPKAGAEVLRDFALDAPEMSEKAGAEQVMFGRGADRPLPMNAGDADPVRPVGDAPPHALAQTPARPRARTLAAAVSEPIVSQVSPGAATNAADVERVQGLDVAAEPRGVARHETAELDAEKASDPLSKTLVQDAAQPRTSRESVPENAAKTLTAQVLTPTNTVGREANTPTLVASAAAQPRIARDSVPEIAAKAVTAQLQAPTNTVGREASTPTLATSAQSALVQGRLSLGLLREATQTASTAPTTDGAKLSWPRSDAGRDGQMLREVPQPAQIAPPAVPLAAHVTLATIATPAPPAVTPLIPGPHEPELVSLHPPTAVQMQALPSVEAAPKIAATMTLTPRTEASLQAMMVSERKMKPISQPEPPPATPVSSGPAAEIMAPATPKSVEQIAPSVGLDADPPSSVGSTSVATPHSSFQDSARPILPTEPAALPRTIETVQGIARQIATQIPASGASGFDIALAPEELGSVRIRLMAAESGSVLLVQAERPETMDLMRRHIAALEHDLRALGHESLTVRFTQNGTDGGFGNTGSGRQAAPQHAEQSGNPDVPHGTEGAPPTAPRLASAALATDHLDLRL